MTNKFEILGLSQALGRFDQIERQLVRDAGEAVQETVLEVAFEAKRDAPVDLGTLRQSINSEYSSTNLEGAVYANAKHAPYIEFGTGGMVEVPQGFEEMANGFRGAGIRRVNLPARPFLIPAANNGMKNLQIKLLRILK